MNKVHKKDLLNLSIHFLIYFFIVIDTLLLSGEHKTEHFNNFYNISEVATLKGTKTAKYILECKSGKIYYLKNFPKALYTLEDNQKLKISSGSITNKIIEIGYYSQENYFALEKTIFSSFYAILLYLIIFTFLFFNLFLKTKLTEFLALFADACGSIILIAYIISIFLYYFR